MVDRTLISRELEDKLKRIYPESKALDMDRKFNSERILDPANIVDIKEWAKKPQKYDLKGFDTKSGAELSKTKVLKKLSRMFSGDSGEQAIELEPERFVDKSEAGTLIANNKDNIKDYESFLKTVEKSWGKDPSLINLLANVKNKESLRNMYNTDVIQNYVLSNTKIDMIGYIMKRFGVEQVRASNVVNSLSKDVRSRLYQRTKLKNIAKLDKISRRLPTSRWSTQEINIIKANPHLDSVKMTKVFKDLTAYNRNELSIRKKMRELGMIKK